MSIDLFFDTETTGFLAAQEKGHEHPDQPDCIQLAAQLYDGPRLISEFSTIIVNSVQPIGKGAQDVHGITPEDVTAYGCNAKLALTMFKFYLTKCHRLIAFNTAYDWGVLRTAMHRAFGQDLADMKAEYGFEVLCSMLSAVDVVKKPSRFEGKYGWPKLQEAYCALVDPAGFGNAHDAMVDVRALVAVTHALERQGVMLLRPKGH